MTDPMIAETIRHNLYERRIARRLGDHGAASKYEARVIHAIDFARRLESVDAHREKSVRYDLRALDDQLAAAWLVYTEAGGFRPWSCA